MATQFNHKRGLGRIALGAAGLGVAFGAHAAWLLLRGGGAHPLETRWCLYALALTGFHFGEFVLTALHQPGDVTYDSFLINHSTAYTLAALASWAEFALGAALAPEGSWLGALKRSWALAAVGALAVTGGQALRSAAMHTAGRSFTHLVATRKRQEHVLVTGGVYALIRHPAYCGWFAWSVGTQLLLANPLCAAAYAYAAWRFFAERIPIEEGALLSFFGGQYSAYARRTVTGVPFVSTVAGAISDEAAEAMRKDYAARQRALEGQRGAPEAPAAAAAVEPVAAAGKERAE